MTTATVAIDPTESAGASFQVTVEFETDTRISKPVNIKHGKIGMIHWVADGINGQTFTAAGTNLVIESMTRRFLADGSTQAPSYPVNDGEGTPSDSLALTVVPGESTAVSDPVKAMKLAACDLVVFRTPDNDNTGFFLVGLTQ